MVIEWDPAKRESNLAKHGIDFVVAIRIFNGPTVERTDPRRVHREERIVATGAVGPTIQTVVYTIRGDRRRIISARRARHNEEAAYRALRSRETRGPD